MLDGVFDSIPAKFAMCPHKEAAVGSIKCLRKGWAVEDIMNRIALVSLVYEGFKDTEEGRLMPIVA